MIMNTILIFTRNISIELFKLKRSFAFWLTIIGASFIPLIYFIYYALKYKSLIPADDVNPWDNFLTIQIMSAASLLIPLFIVLITSLIIQIEHKANAVKFVFTQPMPKWSIYFSKLLSVIGMIVFTYALFFMMMVISGKAAGTLHHELGLLSHSPNLSQPLKLLFRSFIASMGIVSIQFWISFRFKNFIVPLGIGIVLVITGLIVFQAEESVYFPYAYNRLSLFLLASEKGQMAWFPNISLFSLIYFIVFSILGYLDISKINIKY